MSWPFTDSPDYATTEDTGPDLEFCPNISIEGSSIELDGQMPRAVDCGRVAVLRSRRDPTVGRHRPPVLQAEGLPRLRPLPPPPAGPPLHRRHRLDPGGSPGR